MSTADEVRDLRLAFTATWPMRLFSGWLLLFIIVFLYNLFRGNPGDRTSAAALLVCGACTLLFWLVRERAARLWSRLRLRPPLRFVLAGSLGAAWVETVFWAFEKFFGATGVAASPNLLIDLAVTMPWYIMMLILLWKVLTRYRFPCGRCSSWAASMTCSPTACSPAHSRGR